MHNDNPAVRMNHLLHIDPQVKSVQKLRLGLADIRESFGPRNLTRPFVRHPQNELSPSFVGQCDTITGEFFRIELPPCLFEFEMFAFRQTDPFIKLLQSRFHVLFIALLSRIHRVFENLLNHE